jgi:cytochrome c biogenesis protein CcdA
MLVRHENDEVTYISCQPIASDGHIASFSPCRLPVLEFKLLKSIHYGPTSIRDIHADYCTVSMTLRLICIYSAQTLVTFSVPRPRGLG